MQVWSHVVHNYNLRCRKHQASSTAHPTS